MKKDLKDNFMAKWSKYFNGAELPICFFYSDIEDRKSLAKPPKGHRCFVGDLLKARSGKTISFNVDNVGCYGGKRYLGFSDVRMPNFEFFLSYGIPGELEGERYKKSPELVKKFMKYGVFNKAPGSNIVFKRWDEIEEAEEPLVVIFFATPDVLSGLFTLCNFDEKDLYGVIAPFCAGCASIVEHPLKELNSKRPRAVLGMFDVSARPCVNAGELTFSVPWPKFIKMVENMDESFLITRSWQKVLKRVNKNISNYDVS